MERGVRPWLLGAALFVIALAVFAPAAPGPFLFDDRLLIAGNYKVQSFDHWRLWLTETIWDLTFDPASDGSSLIFWRPFVLASFAWDWQLGGARAAVFHLTNLLFHAANAVLVWTMFRRWFDAKGLALILAALFALHPAQTEVACWISGRGDSMCLFGMLLAIHSLHWFSANKALGGLGVFLGTAIACSAKEMAVVLPFLILLDHFASRRIASFTWAGCREVLIHLLVSGLVLVAYVGWRAWLFGSPFGERGIAGVTTMPPALEAFGRAVVLVFWPLDTTLGRAVPRVVEGVVFPRYDYAALGALAFLFINAVAWRWRKTNPRFGLGWLCFLGCWFPVSGIVPHGELSLISPRYLYVPLISIAFMFGALAERFVDLGTSSRQVLWLVAPVVALATISIERSDDYSSSEKFWKAELTQNPYYNAAQDYYVSRELRANRPKSALQLAQAFLEFNRRTGYQALNGELAYRSMEALADVTPDLEVDALRRLAEYCDALVQGKAFTFEVPGVARIGWNKDSTLYRELMRSRRRILLLSADIWSRLGDDKKAIRRVDLAMDKCDQCWTVLARAGTVRARAGQVEETLALTEALSRFVPFTDQGRMAETFADAVQLAPYLKGGSVPPVLGAQFFTSLHAYGRAYAVARPAFENPPDNPEAHRTLAELALRAGDRDAARAMLLRSMSAQEAEEWEREKLKTVLWNDAEVPEGIWTPRVTPDGKIEF